MILKSYWNAFTSVLFPQNCLSCDSILEQGESDICSVCRVNFPRTNFHTDSQNLVAQKFWGKVKLKHAFAYLFFKKQGNIQQLIHRFKYNNQPQIGEILGNWYATELQENQLDREFDLIVPIPLHPKKEKKRGYNQSLYFAKGLSEVWQIPVSENALKKRHHTDSQTKKSRAERYQNMKNGFEISDLDVIRNKDVLLVDDVVTTGATLEVCSALLLEKGAKTVSIATLAVAES